MAKSVAVIGGGVAGLTAAHELKERGFDVTVFEQHLVCGGKARSFPVPAYVKNKAIAGLPAEHGFRFFPGFYKHLIHTFGRIKSAKTDDRGKTYPGRYVIDDLVALPHAAYAQEGKTFYEFPTKSPRTVREYFHALRNAFDSLQLGLQPGEAAFAAVKLLNAMTMCNERREAELDRIAWWDYMSADKMSDAYRKVVVNGLTQNFVAMDAERSSTKSVISILARLLNDFLTAGSTMDRILNGPTSHVWIDPWHEFLKEPPRRPGEGTVTFRLGWRVTSLEFDAKENRVTGIRTAKTYERQCAEKYRNETADAPKEEGFDYYVAAVPVEAMQKILDNSARAIVEHAPSLKSIKRLDVNWMSGVMFYLEDGATTAVKDGATKPAEDGATKPAEDGTTKPIEDGARMGGGHIVYLDSSWALTSILQSRFWTQGFDTSKMRAKGILSTIISDWSKPGTKCCQVTAREVKDHEMLADEVLAQIRAHLRAYPDTTLKQVGYFVDPAILFKRELMGLMSVGSFARRSPAWKTSPNAQQLERKLKAKPVKPDPKEPGAFGNLWDHVSVDNEEPLFINTIGSWSLRPTEITGIDNLFLAADYVKTATDLATMEGANEAGRRAVNGILDAEGSKRKRCEIFDFEEPALLAGFRAIDRELFDRGLPHPSFFTDPFISFGAKAADQAKRWILRK